MNGDESVSGDEVVEQEVEQPVDPVEPEEAQQAADSGDEQAGQDDQNDGDDQSEDRPKPRRKPNQAERRALRAERERDELLRAVLDMQRGNAPKTETQQPKKAEPPKQEDYDSYEAYIDAHVEYRAAQVVDQRLGAARQQSQQQAQARTQQELEAAYHARVDAVQEKYEDFDEVAFSDDVIITNVVKQALVESEYGPDVQYYLGSNPDEAAKIAQMSPTAQIRAIGRLETKFEKAAEAEAASPDPAPAPRKTTSAPEPFKPVGGKKAPGNINPDKLSTEKWMELRAAGSLKY